MGRKKAKGVSGIPPYPFSAGVPFLGFKHMFRSGELTKGETWKLRMAWEEEGRSLWVLAVRNPCMG